MMIPNVVKEGCGGIEQRESVLYAARYYLKQEWFVVLLLRANNILAVFLSLLQTLRSSTFCQY
jgi:hypothetical protein